MMSPPPRTPWHLQSLPDDISRQLGSLDSLRPVWSDDMNRSSSRSAFGKVRAPVRQVLAVDGGSRGFKLLLAESDFGRVRILKEELLDLQAEGLVSPEELRTHIEGFRERSGHPPVALLVPEHLSTSQIIDLP